MSTFVLVHGAFVGGWGWRWVAPYLRAAGHTVHAPTLSGHGDRVHLASPAIDLDTHITDVLNVLHYEDLTDVVLVGWSYGGMIVAGAADRAPERIGHLIYLDSDVPRDGDTSVPLERHTARAALANAHGEGWYVPAAVTSAETLLLTGLPADIHQWILDRFTPHLLKTWTQPIHLTGAAATMPTTYIRCTTGSDPTDIDTARQDTRIHAEPSWHYHELPETHAAPFTAPQSLADLLLEIAQSRTPAT